MDVQKENLRRWDFKAILGVGLTMGAFVILLLPTHGVGRFDLLGFLIRAGIGLVTLILGSYLLITHAPFLRVEQRWWKPAEIWICRKCGFGNKRTRTQCVKCGVEFQAVDRKR
ncbi:MAG: zinc finger Ran-binding domain-containing protein [Candidatus Thorarchaeota archaeon]